MNNYGTGDQILLTAFCLKEAMLSGGVNEKVNLTYLEAEENYYLKYLDDYLKTEVDDLTMDYKHLCEFYKNILLNKKDFKNKNFDPLKSLQECINKLKELKYHATATLYEGWYAYLGSKYGKAQALFQLILNNTEEVSPELVSKAQEGMEWAVDGIDKDETKKPQETKPGK